MNPYNSLFDPNLAEYFSSPIIRDNLRRAGFITRRGKILLPGKVYNCHGYKLKHKVSEELVNYGNRFDTFPARDGTLSARKKEFDQYLPILQDPTILLGLLSPLASSTKTKTQSNHSTESREGTSLYSRSKCSKTKSQCDTWSKRQSFCQIKLQFLGMKRKPSRNSKLPNFMSIQQQHCGGNTLSVFENYVTVDEIITFSSRRNLSFPLGLTIDINRIMVCRLSACCEYKYKEGSLIGGKIFKIVSINGGLPCLACQLRLKNRTNSFNDKFSDQFKSTQKYCRVLANEKRGPQCSKDRLNMSPNTSTDQNSFVEVNSVTEDPTSKDENQHSNKMSQDEELTETTKYSEISPIKSVDTQDEGYGLYENANKNTTLSEFKNETEIDPIKCSSDVLECDNQTEQQINYTANDGREVQHKKKYSQNSDIVLERRSATMKEGSLEKSSSKQNQTPKLPRSETLKSANISVFSTKSWFKHREMTAYDKRTEPGSFQIKNRRKISSVDLGSSNDTHPLNGERRCVCTYKRRQKKIGSIYKTQKTSTSEKGDAFWFDSTNNGDNPRSSCGTSIIFHDGQKLISEYHPSCSKDQDEMKLIFQSSNETGEITVDSKSTPLEELVEDETNEDLEQGLTGSLPSVEKRGKLYREKEFESEDKDVSTFSELEFEATKNCKSPDKEIEISSIISDLKIEAPLDVNFEEMKDTPGNSSRGESEEENLFGGQNSSKEEILKTTDESFTI